MKDSDPIGRLRREIDENNVKGFVLILNSMDEEEVYLRNISLFSKYNHKVALLLDVHSGYFLNGFKKLDEKGIRYIVKIHPRIGRITKNDFDMVKGRLDSLSYQTIIVDDWIFGCQTDCHTGTGLAIYLARSLPEKNVVVAHAGGYKIIETMLFTRPVQNIYYDLSLTQLYFQGASIELDLDYFIKWTSKRILFGSDYPDFGICEAWKAFQRHYHNAGLLGEAENTVALARSVYGLE